MRGLGTRLERFTGRDSERGVILPLAAVFMVVAVIATAMAIDLGAIAWKRRDLQKIADLASIDAAYGLAELNDEGWLPLDALDPGAILAATTNVEDRAWASAIRNGLDPLDADEFVVEMGEYDREADPRFTTCEDLFSTLGLCDPNAVRIAVTDGVPKFFDIVSEGERSTSVDAISALDTSQTSTSTPPSTTSSSTPPTTAPPPPPATDELASFAIGSFLTRVDSGDNDLATTVFEELLGAPPGSLSADVVSYRGIADADMTLDNLVEGFNAATSLTFGSVEEMLAASITVDDLLVATAEALSLNSEDAASAQVQAIDQAVPVAVPGQNFSLSEVIAVDGLVADGTIGAGASVDIAVLELITASAAAANGENAVSVNPAAADLPEGLASATATIRLIEPPTASVGLVRPGTPEATIETAQVEFVLDVVPDAEVLGSVGLPTDVVLHFSIGIAEAQATLTDVLCTGSTVDGVQIDAATTLLTTGAGTGGHSVIEALPADILPFDPLLFAEAAGTQSIPGATATLAFGPPTDPPEMQTVGVVPSLDAAFTVALEALEPVGIDLEATRQQLEAIMGDSLDPVFQLVDAMAGSLGVTLAGADVWVYDATCSETTTTTTTIPGSTTSTSTPGSGSSSTSSGRVPILVE